MMRILRIGILVSVLAALSGLVVYTAASYPSAVKSFTTRLAGATISASHINDLQDEVAAIEGGLINGLAHDLKFTDALYDIGKSGATRPRDFFLSRNATIGGTLAVTGASTLTGNTTVGGTFGVTGAATLSSTLAVTGDVYTAVWTDYSATSTVTGWTSFTTKTIRYKKLGKLVFVAFMLEGTSNATTSSFTVANASANTGVDFSQSMAGDWQDNGVVLTSNVQARIAANTSTIDLRRDAAATAWTNSGTKRASGVFWYEAGS